MAGEKILDSFGGVVNYQNHYIDRLVPRKLVITDKIKTIKAGLGHNGVITDKKELYLWGDNEMG